MHKIFTFLAFNLLLFAVYLNFIHKDNGTTLPVAVHSNEFIKRDSTVRIDQSDEQSRSLSLDRSNAAKLKPGDGDRKR